MDILNTILPVYDALEKQEQYRGYDHVTRVCPRLQLLPFLCKRAHSASDQYLSSIKLIDCAGTETEILSYFRGENTKNIWISAWTNVTYDTFTTSVAGGNPISITSAINAAGGAQAKSGSFTVVTGAIYYITVTLTLTSGEAPILSIADAGTDKSNAVSLVNGSNTVILKATGSGNFQLTLNNTAASNFSLSNPKVSRMSVDFYAFTSVDYFQYNGPYLRRPLPLGRYYLKMTDGVNIFYSERFDVQDVYTNQCLSWTNSGATAFETLTTSGPAITEAINSSGSARCYATPIAVANGETIKVVFQFSLNTGDFPTLAGYESPGAADIVTGEATCVDGLNEVTLVCTKSTLLTVGFNIASNTNFSVTFFQIYRVGADKHAKISFTNTLDLSDILYQNGLTQLFFAQGGVKEITGDVTTEGDIRDGALIEEKIVTAPKFSAIHPCSPLLGQALETLKQHTTVAVTGMTGVIYAANNIEVENSPEYFDINKVVINFTANEKVWTLNQNNIT